ncbi:Alpha-glucosidase [Cyphellophora attinorum]|uniref:Alpha-glucosidase n=1 Tax=Cyphellophora attinorum TaxID=1664694 RepID=A0A0N0NLW6_9EURO|nr:Alpha-glucosidase [Phialophora attinorum]KPI39658.1 Alpha-glucosidase [Phialophora attinorum]
MASSLQTKTLPPTTNLTMEIRHNGLDTSSITPKPNTASSKRSWWKTTTVYQIWPASFLDTTGSGLGDLRGIICKLPYLHNLGIETIWLSPMYDGPQQDMGYDISDYTAIYPPYGTMEDMEELIAKIHALGMRIILDLVVNHTSDQHKWFQSSKTGNGLHKDWYIWRDGKPNPKPSTDANKPTIPLPPNNWASVFGGPAWTWCPSRQQYYLHIFAPGQPDLDWENDAVRAAVHKDALRFWFEKGIDGFRVDTCNIYSKNQKLLARDGRVTERTKPLGECDPGIINGPRIHEFWSEMRREVINKYVGGDPLMVGELADSSVEETLRFIGRTGPKKEVKEELSMVFDFSYVDLGREDALPHLIKPIDLPAAKRAMGTRTSNYLTAGAWTSIFKENHDRPRSVSRHPGPTDPKNWSRIAKLLAMMTGTLSGTLFLYQGEEIGMTNINPDTWSPGDLKDIASLNYLQAMRERYPNDPVMWDKAWRGVCAVGRDNARTPVQWANRKNGGFSDGSRTWMRVNENYREGVNVEEQEGKQGSVLEFWRRMLKLRRREEGLFVLGGYRCVDEENERTWTFEKTADGGKGRAWVVLNFSDDEVEFERPKWARELALTNYGGERDTKEDKLAPWEGRIYM